MSESEDKKPVERYPKDLPITEEDFRRSPWKEIFLGTADIKYLSAWNAYSQAAREAIQAGRVAEGKVLWLLSDACSMALRPDSPNEPFGPNMVWKGGWRSCIADDLTDSDAEFFSQIVAEVDVPWLQARIADILWVIRVPREVRFALLAIDAYRKISLDLDTWLARGSECWARALQLAMMIGRGGGSRGQEIESSLLGALLGSTISDGFFGGRIGELLLSNGLGRGNLEAVAKRFEDLGRLFEQSRDFSTSREYFLAASKWFERSKKMPDAYRMIASAAESIATDGHTRIARERPSHAEAAGLFEQSIHTYRGIPKAHRAAFNADKRITELHTLLNDSGERAVAEMSPGQTHSFDVTKIAEEAQELVRGKSAADALHAFANIHPGFEEVKIKEQAQKNLKSSFFKNFLGATYFAGDGRVMAKKPPTDLSGSASPANRQILWTEMVHSYTRQLEFVVGSQIMPALEVILMEHRIPEIEFTRLAEASPIVPPRRERLYGRALFRGYEGDFPSALHLLVPQLENMVRWHLKGKGVKTRTLGDDGIQTENGMSALVVLPEVREIFGNDIAFELKALFCVPEGPNLRNNLAHGLLGMGASQSVFSIYAWWLGLRIAFNTYWNATRDPQNEGPEEPDTASS